MCTAIYFGQLHLPVILFPWKEWCQGIMQPISSYNQVLHCDFQWPNIGCAHTSVLSSLFQKWGASTNTVNCTDAHLLVVEYKDFYIYFNVKEETLALIKY